MTSKPNPLEVYLDRLKVQYTKAGSTFHLQDGTIMEYIEYPFSLFVDQRKIYVPKDKLLTFNALHLPCAFKRKADDGYAPLLVCGISYIKGKDWYVAKDRNAFDHLVLHGYNPIANKTQNALHGLKIRVIPPNVRTGVLRERYAERHKAIVEFYCKCVTNGTQYHVVTPLDVRNARNLEDLKKKTVGERYYSQFWNETKDISA